ncbi:MAG: U32 family peptidase, partial [Clostridiales bacterium]|nr:U32 family peptidase [Clostridiales bacterium]
MNNNRIELLAPAGNLKILKAAVDHGADAVYLGIGAYNARINAENFTSDDLAQGINYAHLRSSKVYLTLNTLINDYEMDEALKLACDAYVYGVDGIIIQDIGLASRIHEKYPDITLNASTQMNVYSEEEFKKLSEMGFKRIVLPRELSVDEIARRTNIAKRFGMTTEVFAHGAVCVCYSGLCLFSAMNKGGTRSGNRGLCAQPCRQEYKLSNDGLVLDEGHLLSPKDRDVIDYISGLINAGVSSLKLEGRMRDINYVSSAVSSYRKILDAFYDGSLDQDLIDSVKRDLLVNFNRGGSFTSQYLSGNKPDDLLSGEYVGKFGLLLGKIKTMDPKKGTITVSRNTAYPIPSKGDFLSIRSKNKEITSFPVGKLHEGPDFLAVKGLHPDMIKKTERGMEIYLMGHKTEIEKKDKKRTHIDLSLDLEGRSLKLNAMVNSGMNYGIFAETSVELEEGENIRPLSEDRIKEQLSKTLDTPFTVDNIYFVKSVDQGFPVSFINDLRRKVIDMLTEEIDNSYKRAVNPRFQIPGFAE